MYDRFVKYNFKIKRCDLKILVIYNINGLKYNLESSESRHSKFGI